MRDVALDEPPYPRDMAQIAGLFVAHAEPGEDADDAQVALGAHHGKGAGEGLAVERREGGEVAGEHGFAQALGHLAPRILEQRDQIMRHVAERAHPRVILSHEPELLETGGGVVKALAELAPGPFYVINSDSLWLDGGRGALERLAEAWDEQRMDVLLVLQEVERANGYAGAGDFHRAPDGRLQRRREGERAPFLFTGVQLLSERLFDGAKVERFSLNRLYDRAIGAGRLFGLVHDGAFFHVGTPEGLALAERALAGERPAGKPFGGGG